MDKMTQQNAALIEKISAVGELKKRAITGYNATFKIL
jgi:hypothetical protein